MWVQGICVGKLNTAHAAMWSQSQGFSMCFVTRFHFVLGVHLEDISNRWPDTGRSGRKTWEKSAHWCVNTRQVLEVLSQWRRVCLMVRREQRKEVGSVDQRASYWRCERMQSVVKARWGLRQFPGISAGSSSSCWGSAGHNRRPWRDVEVRLASLSQTSTGGHGLFSLVFAYISLTDPHVASFHGSPSLHVLYLHARVS